MRHVKRWPGDPAVASPSPRLIVQPAAPAATNKATGRPFGRPVALPECMNACCVTVAQATTVLVTPVGRFTTTPVWYSISPLAPSDAPAHRMLPMCQATIPLVPVM